MNNSVNEIIKVNNTKILLAQNIQNAIAVPLITAC